MYRFLLFCLCCLPFSLSAQLSADQQLLISALDAFRAAPAKVATTPAETREQQFAYQEAITAFKSIAQPNLLQAFEDEAAYLEAQARQYQLLYFLRQDAQYLNRARKVAEKTLEVYCEAQSDDWLKRYLEETYGLTANRLSALKQCLAWEETRIVEGWMLESWQNYLQDGSYNWREILSYMDGRVPISSVMSHIYAVIGAEHYLQTQDCPQAFAHLVALSEMGVGASIEVAELHPPITVEFQPKIDGPDELMFFPGGPIFPYVYCENLGVSGCSPDRQRDWQAVLGQQAWTTALRQLERLSAERCGRSLREKDKESELLVGRHRSSPMLVSSPVIEPHLPALDFPLPGPSGQVKFPTATFAGLRTFGHLGATLENALHASGYYDLSYYAAPGGFALVTRLEQIDADGDPLPEPDRWKLALAPARDFSLSRLLRALFFTDPGYFRVIFFLVTDHSHFTDASEELSREQAMSMVSEGAGDLGRLAHAPMTNRHRVYALVYEFEVFPENHDPQASQSKRLPGQAHLDRAGLWDRLRE
jgi:hypothetical protein